MVDIRVCLPPSAEPLASLPVYLSGACMCLENGGFFGQHAWTEVYMGEAGWIPVDATLKEYDYIDSGHIRLGEGTSFHPKKVEILEYKTGTIEESDSLLNE